VRVPRHRLADGAPRLPREQSLSEPRVRDGRPWDELIDSGAPAPDETAARRQQRARLGRALARLPARQRLVLERRFGLDAAGDGCTLRDLAAELGVSKERVRQIEGEGLARLRGCLLLPASALAGTAAPP
jgi:RNA polymerase sigma factor (sigma-70 family)